MVNLVNLQIIFLKGTVCVNSADPLHILQKIKLKMAFSHSRIDQ